MKVLFNPNTSANQNLAFCKKRELKEFGPIDRTLTSDELCLKRTKKVIAQASVGVIGICLLYFKVKKHLKIRERIKNDVKYYEMIKRRRDAFLAQFARA